MLKLGELLPKYCPEISIEGKAMDMWLVNSSLLFDPLHIYA